MYNSALWGQNKPWKASTHLRVANTWGNSLCLDNLFKFGSILIVQDIEKVKFNQSIQLLSNTFETKCRSIPGIHWTFMGHYSVMIMIIASSWNIDLRQNLLLWVFTKVEHIVAKRHQRGKAVYFIQWKNYSPAENTWEPAEHLTKELLCIHFVLMNPERASLFYSRGAWNRP